MVVNRKTAKAPDADADEIWKMEQDKDPRHLLKWLNPPDAVRGHLERFFLRHEFRVRQKKAKETPSITLSELNIRYFLAREQVANDLKRKKRKVLPSVALPNAARAYRLISQGRTEEELEKRLGAALLAGDPAISLDNCEHVLQSAFLCQALTQQQLSIRLLGLSKIIETPVNATILATGNNLTIAGDLTRRTIMCSLDAHCEHPEQRQFEVDPIAAARANRPELIVAALTVLRAWHASGETVRRSPLGSFEEWSHRIRAPLLWLD
jgi:hypothetical protein